MDVDDFNKILEVSILSVIGLFTALFSYVVFNDYFMVPVYNVASQLESSGIIGSWILAFIELLNDNVLILLNIIDYVWIIAFVSFSFSLIRKSYYAKREGYLNLFSMLTIGALLLLFLSSIYEQITNYLYNVFFNGILQNITISLPFFSYYIDNYSIINLILIILCVLANVMDLDLMNYFTRKDKEKINTGTNENQL